MSQDTVAKALPVREDMHADNQGAAAWSPVEDGVLRELHNQKGDARGAISAGISGRSKDECRDRLLNVLGRAPKDGTNWTLDEDRLLLQLHG